MNHINQETGELIAVSRSPRFTLWVAFLAFSTITLGSSVEVKNERGKNDGDSRWAVAMSAIAFTVTAVVVLMHLSAVHAIHVVGTKAEGIICLGLVVCWVIIVSVIANADSGLAVQEDEDNTIINGNLYYFGWAGFVTSILLLISYLRAVFGVDLAGELRSRSKRLTLWAAVLACALVVMGSSANIFDKDCSPQQQTDAFCSRTKYGISLGAITTIFSLVVVGLKMATSVAPFYIEAAFSVLLCILNGFGVAFLTSPKGPGSPIGNLYYFTWISFILCFMLIADCYNDFNATGKPEDEINGQPGGNGHMNGHTTGEIPIEPLEDTI